MNPNYLWRMCDGEVEHEEEAYHDEHYRVLTAVVKDPETGKLYQFSYERAHDGEYNTWRDGDVSESDVNEVEAYTETVTVTKYRRVSE